MTPLSAAEAAALMPGLLGDPPAPDAARAAEEPITWHDPALPIAERMKLAEGRALPLRMMAAMAQQDCGQCGSSCEEYSRSIFVKAEQRLNLCVPGGKDTSRMLKKLCEEIGAAPAAAVGTAPAVAAVGTAPAVATEAAPSVLAPAALPGSSRDNPVTATVISRTGSTGKARKRKPGTSSSTSPNPGSITPSATASASCR